MTPVASRLPAPAWYCRRLLARAKPYLRVEQLIALRAYPEGRARLNILVGQIASLPAAPDAVRPLYLDAIALLEGRLWGKPCQRCGTHHERRHNWCSRCHRAHTLGIDWRIVA